MGILRAIAGLLVCLWLIGLLVHVGGAFIHLLLIVAIIMFLIR